MAGVALLIVGLSHKTAPVEFRERLSFSEDRQREAVREIVKLSPIKEAVLLSTCNRTELYTIASSVEAGVEALIDYLAAAAGLNPIELKKYLYFYNHEHAVLHLFRVVSSLESMVVGEAQILGQVKEAYDLAFQEGATDTVLNRLLRHAFKVGKRVRTETAIGESAVSISYAAVELAKQVFGVLDGNTVMVVGAGEMSELTVVHLLDNGIKKVIVTNRTFARAQELAEKFRGEAVPFEAMFEAMEAADIVISSTGASEPIINRQEMIKVMKARRFRPIFLIDIAVPRDINTNVNKLRNVFLYDIDDLQQVVEANVAERMREAEKAEVMIEAEVEEFVRWRRSLEVVPTIKAIRDMAEKIRVEELAKSLPKISLNETEVKEIDALTRLIVNKLLHEPTIRLKDISRLKDGPGYVNAIRHLFGLDEAGDS